MKSSRVFVIICRQVFASIYLPGPLLILLPQAAIPISMAFSNRITGERFRLFQYAGAIVVIVGILVVLEPLMSHRNSPDNVCEAIDMDNYYIISFKNAQSLKKI